MSHPHHKFQMGHPLYLTMSKMFVSWVRSVILAWHLYILHLSRMCICQSEDLPFLHYGCHQQDVTVRTLWCMKYHLFSHTLLPVVIMKYNLHVCLISAFIIADFIISFACGKELSHCFMIDYMCFSLDRIYGSFPMTYHMAHSSWLIKWLFSPDRLCGPFPLTEYMVIFPW